MKSENVITSKEQALEIDMDKVPIDDFWNNGIKSEAKMHSIHIYPAKFPAFIAEKAIEHAKERVGNILCVSDIFCGCGTVALEAYRHSIDFWGCDINPVATMIAQVKSSSYQVDAIERNYKRIKQHIINIKLSEDEAYDFADMRLKYWYSKEQYFDLLKIKESIDILPKSKYKRAFICLFSSILKPTSKWLTKSIKPQIDPQKVPVKPMDAFDGAVKRFQKIVASEKHDYEAQVKIENCNFLTKKKLPTVDLIITSPPYVTSYEYADLHQLSSLWLEYTDDYTELRKGTIGSVYNSEDYYFDLMDLNATARRVVAALYESPSIGNAKTKSVARYYVDMQQSVKKSYEMLSPRGSAYFIIGDTEYKGIRIENGKHLIESLINCGFRKVTVSKRMISKKNLSPYRDESGKFSSDHTQRKVYHEEYVIIAYKNAGVSL
jgi:DNA modification methylase